MKWTYTIQNKVVASAALFALCLLVLFSNILDRGHTNSIKNSIQTLYQDRIVAEDIILKMTRDVYQIKEALTASASNADSVKPGIASMLTDLQTLRGVYQKTKLTENEKKTFATLQNILDDFKTSTLNGKQTSWEDANEALVLLDELSTIQLEESKIIMHNAEALYSWGKASSQFAFAIIVVILLVLQSLVFTSKTLTAPNQSSASYLN